MTNPNLTEEEQRPGTGIVAFLTDGLEKGCTD